MTSRYLSMLVCDLDVTLLDSLPDLASALNQLLAEKGRPPIARKKILSMVGDGAAKMVERGCLGTGAALRAKDLDAAFSRFLRIYDAVLTAPCAGMPSVLVSFGYCGVPPASLGADRMSTASLNCRRRCSSSRRRGDKPRRAFLDSGRSLA